MSGNSSLAPKIFLLKAELPVNLLMTRNAVFAATQIAELLSFSPKSKYELELAMEEGFSNAVQHFSKANLEDERIYIEFTIEDSALIISIRENGIPFEINKADRFTPDSPEGLEKPGLGTFLMEQVMDSVEYFVHGREGKETRLKKKITSSVIPKELVLTTPHSRGKKRQLVINALCREATEADLAQICRLAWKCYGYTQEDLLYNLDLLKEKFKKGEVKPIIFIDPDSGNMIAHEALKYHDPNVRVPELGLAFIDPAYRCPNLTKRFSKEASRISKEHDDKGLFDCSVTTHIFSQRAVQEYLGSTPCGIMLGIAATGMQAKELTTTQQKKGSIINHYLPFDKTSHKIYIPDHHKKMLQKIYDWMDLPREFLAPEIQEPTGESSIVTFPLPDELNVSFIIVNNIGANSVEEIRQSFKSCKNERRDAVYIFIPSGVPYSPYIVKQCEEIGFFFAGIMPHIHNGDDRITLQWLNIDLDFSKIKVYGDKSTVLLNYISYERKRVGEN